MADFIGKLENIHHDWKRVYNEIVKNHEQIGEKSVVREMIYLPISHGNRGKRKSYQDSYNRELWKIIKKRYQDDIELFGYQQIATNFD
jgi:hypothetical protein